VKCAAALRRHLQPWNQLQQLLIEKMRRDDLTLKDVATSSGVNRTTIRRWFNERERYLTSSNLDKVAAFLGFGLAEAIPLAGGHTGEEEMARTGRANIDAGRPTPGTKKFDRARARAGKTMRGRTHSPEWNARIGASLATAGAPEWGAAKLRALQATPDGQACQRLWVWLRWHPDPTREQIRSRAQVVGDRLDRSEGEVLASWLPHIKARGLWATGRPAMERRHFIVAALRAWWPDRVQGLWDLAAWWVGQDSDDDLSGPELANWWKFHQRACTGVGQRHPEPWTDAAERLPPITAHRARVVAGQAKLRGEVAYRGNLGSVLPEPPPHKTG
jgi:AcrR family transcriptional regulator